MRLAPATRALLVCALALLTPRPALAVQEWYDYYLTARGRNIPNELASLGISLQAAGRRTVEAEISEAYKDVAHVVAVVRIAGLPRLVARVQPFVVVEGCMPFWK